MTNECYNVINLIINSLVAIGTIGASITALYIANTERKKNEEERITLSICIEKKIMLNGTEKLINEESYTQGVEEITQHIDNNKYLSIIVKNIGFRSITICSISITSLQNKMNLVLDGAIFNTDFSNTILPQGEVKHFYTPYEFIVKNRHLLGGYKNTKPPQNDIEITLETHMGNLFTCKLPPKMHLDIQKILLTDAS